MTTIFHDSFEDGLWNHNVKVFPVGGEPYETEVGNIFVPKGWKFWFRHDAGTWDQPEARHCWRIHDPNRVKEGDGAWMFFGFCRRYDAGLMRRLGVGVGKKVRFTAWAHAWSNHSLEGHEACCDDGRCSCGVGKQVIAIAAEDIPDLNEDPWNDALGNSMFTLGIDPNGGEDPFSPDVEWGSSFAIYNGYAKQLVVEATAGDGGVVTVFFRSKTLWPFKHNDAYLDKIEVSVTDGEEQPPEERGQPRKQYERTYVLLPPGAGKEWVLAVVDATWENYRYTVGGSADDAGIGDLDARCVLAVNPDRWPGDLRTFFQEHYPGVLCVSIEADTPEHLRQILAGDTEPPPTPSTDFTLRGVHDIAGADWLLENGLEGWCTVARYLGTDPQQLDLQKYADAGIRIVLRLSYSYAQDDGGGGTMPPPDRLEAHEYAVAETMRLNPSAWGFIYGNEPNNKREWPHECPLTPMYYLASYNRVWASKPLTARLSPCAIDPYNPGWGDWRDSWYHVLCQITDCDFLAVHAYTHGPNTDLVWHRKEFEHAPLIGVYYDMRVLESQQDIVPGRFWNLPVIVAETNHWVRRDGEIGWEPDAGAWVNEAYRYFASKGVAGACLFRHAYIQWRYGDLPGILEELRNV